jgi:hypothetical protein
MQRLRRHCSASQWRAACAYLGFVDDILAETEVATTYPKELWLAKNDERAMRYPGRAEQELHPLASALFIAEIAPEVGGRGGMERARELYADATRCEACEREHYAACAGALFFRDDPLAHSKPCACVCQRAPQ